MGEPADGIGGFAGFTLAFSAAFGYSAGWNPYATDYTRYLPIDIDRSRVGLMAGLGNFAACSLLMIVGAASVTIGTADTGNPTSNFTAPMPSLIANLVLLGIALGAISANALNIYSGSMSFLAMGIKLPLSLRRAIVALGFGAIGLVLAWNGLADAGANYEAFLLVIAYWIAPWLGVVLTDRLLRRGTVIDDIVEDTTYVNLAGPISMLAGMVVSIWLFSAQVEYTGPVAKANPGIGDLTLFVGFTVSALLYLVLFTVLKPKAPVTRTPVSTPAPV
jgi:purine-cytosine permease-like protein